MTDVTVSADGTKRWYNASDQRHREDGPAVEYPDGTKMWCRDDLLHREDGPVIEYASGALVWKTDTGFETYYPDFGCFKPTSREEALERLNSKERLFSYDLYMADIDRMFPRSS